LSFLKYSSTLKNNFYVNQAGITKKDGDGMGLVIADLASLGQYTIDAIEDSQNEIDIKPEILNDLKKEVTATKRVIKDVPQNDPELNKIVSYFRKHRKIVDEVTQKPLVNMDIEFTIRFVCSNQRRINEILSQ
jgi:hypothetical protein